MSTLAKTYALACGVKIGEPFIVENFYPLDWPLEKTILLHGSAGARNERGEPNFPAKIYDHYDEVLKLLNPVIEKFGYRVYQIGGPNEKPINGAVNISGLTTIKQAAYLIKNCALFFGNDSMNAHIAGSYRKPLVVLYGPTDPKNHGPEWKDESKTILLESHRFKEKRPSYAAHEAAKTINAIPPELVANSALKLLNIEQTFNHDSFMFGAAYKNQILEIVPNTQLRPDFFPELGIAVRMDYFHDENGLAANLQQRKCSIFADKPFNLDILRACKKNLAFCRFKIGTEITPKFIREVVRLGVPCLFYTEENDEQKLKDLRYEYFDFCVIDKAQSTTVEDFWKLSERYTNKTLGRDIKLSELTYKTNKYLISKDGISLSHAAWKNGIRTKSLNENEQLIGDLYKDADFWKELQHFYIFRK